LGQAPLVAVGGSAPAHHHLHDLDLDVGVVGAHELLQESMGIIAGILEASLLDGGIEFLPFQGEAARPLLAGLGLAVNFASDGIPGLADGAHFRGGGEKGVHVVAHDVTSRSFGFCRERPLWRSRFGDAEAIRISPERIGGCQVAERHGGRSLQSRTASTHLLRHGLRILPCPTNRRPPLLDGE
jgi:hypothetical protein